MTHLLLIAIFYCLWRLPGHATTTTTSSGTTSPSTTDIWYDARQTADECSHDNDNDDEPPLSATDDAWLATQVPQSTPAERWRFFTAKQRHRQAAALALQTYTEWRQQHEKVKVEDNHHDDDDDDEDLRAWNKASLIAQRVGKEKCTTVPLPKVAHLHQHPDTKAYLRDRTGHRLLHFLPGRMDDTLASTKTYALAVALYVNERLDRHGTERVTVVIDARGGHGWRNLNAAQLLPFIQHLATLMLTMFPQRLHAACVFPIPPRFYWVWRIVRRCLDERTAAKIQPLEGPSTIDSPPPMQRMGELLGTENAAFLETFRKAGFLA